MSASREVRAASFDADPARYDRMRPHYPPQLYDDLQRLAGLQAGSRVLEIGCGPGTFTEPMLVRQWAVEAVELGAAVAAYVSRKLAGLRVWNVPFEAFESSVPYSLVVAASSFHWLDPATRFERCARLLVPHGFLALCRNRAVPNFQEAVLPIYQQVAPDLANHGEGEEFPQSPLFSSVARLEYRFELAYSSQDYVELMNTYSDHATLPDDVRHELYRRIVELADAQYDGQVRCTYLSLLDLRRLLP